MNVAKLLKNSKYVVFNPKEKKSKLKKKRNVYKKDDKSLVAVEKCPFEIGKTDLKRKIKETVDHLGGLEKIIKEGDEVFIKPNLNSNDLYPASTDPIFARCAVELCFEAGAKDVIVGDMSGVYWLPTEKAFSLGLREQCEQAGAKVFALENKEWVEIELNAPHWQKAILTKELYKKRKLIYLPCLKTHCSADFTMSLKLSMGLINLGDRLKYFHWKGNKHLNENIGYLNTLMWPDLIILDGRKAFRSGGPSKGGEIESQVIMASGDRVALDVEALKILSEFKAENILKNPWKMEQIKWAVKLKIGALSNDEIEKV